MSINVKDLQSRIIALEGRVLRSRHGLYVPVAPSDLIDTLSNNWNGAARNIGTYTFAPSSNANLWPETATALHVLLLGSWASASATYYLALRRAAVGGNEIYVTPQVANLYDVSNGNVATDNTGLIYAVLAGANAAAAQVRLLGYYT